MTRFATGVSRFVSVQGANIHYQVFNAADMHKPGLLLVHGMWAHLHWWDHIVPFFTDEFRVVSMDLGGMGDSENRPQYTARGFGEEIVGVLDDANIGPATVVAHSFGGTPTIFACYLRPDLIRRAVIIDSRLYLEAMPELRQHEIQQMAVTRKIYARPQDALDRYRLIPPGGIVPPDILQHIAREGLAETLGGWAWKFDPGIHPQLADDPQRVAPNDIRTPIDYVYGENSDVISRTMADAIHAYFPDIGAPIAIPGANHHILLEQPDLLVAVLRSLFSRDAVFQDPRHIP